MEIIVETFRNVGEPSHSAVRVRPVSGQFKREYRVWCSKADRTRYPVGSKFRVEVTEVFQPQGESYLRIAPGQVWKAATVTETRKSDSGASEPAAATELTEALIEGYRRAGREVGYWGRRMFQSLKRNGGQATAKRMLKPRNVAQRAGLDAMLEANRPDLTLEAIILQDRFRSLFSATELEVARARLDDHSKMAKKLAAGKDRLYPDELEPGKEYVEGARKQVRVNAYERNARARKACLAHYGYSCAVCEFMFETRYGARGKDFIHIHHLNPLALSDGEYKLDPIAHLRPVCPNCHAMLHRGDSLLSIEELRAIVVRN